MPQQSRRASRGRPGTTTTSDVSDGGDLLCTCCEPPNPLVPRPDLGVDGLGRAQYAICVFHLPEPTVYRAGPDGRFVPAAGLRLNELGELVDAEGQVVARVVHDGFQRLTTVDDDDLPDEPSGGGGGASQPLGGAGRATYSSTHVDLSQDEFYA